MDTSWEDLLRKLLPEGAPFPDEDHLDYSISFDYVAPSPFFNPLLNSHFPTSPFTPFPKSPLSLTPRNPSRMIDSRSTTEWDTATSISLEFVTDDVSNEAVGDRSQSSPPLDKVVKVKPTGGCFTCVWSKAKGCIRCGKRLGLHEVCIVCGIKYCDRCVLKGMGSMPEGRKCVGCIGMPIDEAYRGRLGKCSKVLPGLWSPLQLKHIMQVERVCKANQVRPHQVIVNGRELRQEELAKLLDCELPPKNLKPGIYWYDKDSGLWGKGGSKPDSMITSELSVGGKLQVDASCGNTKVYMNGREITKHELKVLKLARVECPQGTRFWVYEDGSYEEEGQNNIKGYIWEKASTRSLSSLLSLPVPPEATCCVKEEASPVTNGKFQEFFEENRVQKILLLGVDSSTIGTIFKQAKFKNTDEFTSEELQSIKRIVQSDTLRYLYTLLEGSECFEQEGDLQKKESTRSSAGRTLMLSGEAKSDGTELCFYSLNQKINHLRDVLLDISATGDVETFFTTAARKWVHIISEIWMDPYIQDVYKSMEKQQLIPDVAKYFLDQVTEILGNEYEPSDKDVMLAQGASPFNGITCAEFSLDGCSVISKMHNIPTHISKYQLIQLRSDNGFKWMDMLDGMSAVVFCVSLSDYEKLWTDSRGLVHNKMLASRDYFVNVVKESCFYDTPFLLLLAKKDLIEEKVEQVPLTICEWFRDFNPCPPKNGQSSKRVGDSSRAQQAFHYVAMKFKELYSSITGGRKKLYVYPIGGCEGGSPSDAFRYLREILTWKEVVKNDEGDNMYATEERRRRR